MSEDRISHIHISREATEQGRQIWARERAVIVKQQSTVLKSICLQLSLSLFCFSLSLFPVSLFPVIPLSLPSLSLSPLFLLLCHAACSLGRLMRVGSPAAGCVCSGILMYSPHSPIPQGNATCPPSLTTH